MKIRIVHFLYLTAIFLFVWNIPAISSGNPGERASSVNAVNCQWFFNNKYLPGETGTTIRFRETGNYTVVYVSADGKMQRSTFYYNAITGTKVRLYLIGDSTASSYDASSFPRTGWGQVFQAFFNPDSIEVVNKALSGRSSKSFYTDPAGWPVVSENITAGDYLFIQFGHNDSKDDEERYTDPYTTFKEYLKRYIDEARAKGAVPVLLTSIHRNNWSGTSISDTHGDYPPAMRELALEEDVALIDLTVKTAALFEAYGKETVSNDFFMNLQDSMFINYPDGNSDNTHLQVRGAYEVSKLVYRTFEEQRDKQAMDRLFRCSQPAGCINVGIHAFNMGRVSGDRVGPLESTVTLTAVPARGYLFDYFAMNGEMVSEEPPYDIPLTDSLIYLAAYFTKAYKVNIKTDPVNKAGYTGNGSYRAGDSVTVTVSPNPGYTFLFWTLYDLSLIHI